MLRQKGNRCFAKWVGLFGHQDHVIGVAVIIACILVHAIGKEQFEGLGYEICKALTAMLQ